ncbi:MAG: hypothetical protein AUG51_12345 [Acidobacteria bacterium 13_1_20CM_3_53_8]|nr:MAG: hypothetical protein AUG51_12345 [Acidobacteria bacterium 13_1_20CM_3_53_8]
MKELCFDEAVLQSYFDGELSPETMQSVAAHINACVNCAARAKEIESETELMRGAFAPEMELGVPTESLRARIDSAIKAEQLSAQAREVRKGSNLRAWFASLIPGLNFSPQHVAAFASVLVLIAVAAVFAVIKWQHATNGAGSTGTIATSATPEPTVVTPPEEGTQPSPSPSIENNNQNAPKLYNASGRPFRRPRIPGTPSGNNMVARERAPNLAPPVQSPPPLPDEQGYLKAIASLTNAIDSTGNSTLPPSVQAEYRRNLELIDQAIAATRVAARRNPQDASARQFLYASYQNKVDLLSAVADQTMLVASR